MVCMRRIGLLLSLALVARAGDEPVVHIFDVADLKTDDTWWALAMARVKAAAQGAQVREEGNALVAVAPAAVQEKVAKELADIREAFGKLVQLEVRLVKVEGGLGVASVPAEKLDALLTEKKADSLGAPNLVCRNGQRASLSVLREVSYVADFAITVDENGGVTADPVVETLEDGVTAKLQAFVGGQSVRVAADVCVKEVGEMGEVELPLPLQAPLKVQVPSGSSHSIRRILECAPGAYTVVELGGGKVVLIRATPITCEDLGGDPFAGEDIPLK